MAIASFRNSASLEYEEPAANLKDFDVLWLDDYLEELYACAHESSQTHWHSRARELSNALALARTRPLKHGTRAHETSQPTATGTALARTRGATHSIGGRLCCRARFALTSPAVRALVISVVPIHPSLLHERPAMADYLRSAVVDFLAEMGGAAPLSALSSHFGEIALGTVQARPRPPPPPPTPLLVLSCHARTPTAERRIRFA